MSDFVRSSSRGLAAVTAIVVASAAIAAPPVLDQFDGPESVEPLDLSSLAPLVAVDPAETTAPLVSYALMQDADESPGGRASDWAFKFVLGFGGSYGNTERQSLSTGFHADRKITEGEGDAEVLHEHLRIRVEYFWGESNKVEDENRFIASMLNDWFIPDSKWMFWGRVRYDHDEFQSWDDRLQGHAGVGYSFIDEVDLNFAGRLGAGASKEWGSIDDDIRAEGVVAATLEWNINEDQTLTAAAAYFPELEELSEFRTEESVTWSISLNEADTLSLNASLEHEHQSRVDPGRDKNDTRIAIGIGYEW